MIICLDSMTRYVWIVMIECQTNNISFSIARARPKRAQIAGQCSALVRDGCSSEASPQRGRRSSPVRRAARLRP